MQRTIRYQGAIIRDHHILLIEYREPATGDSYWLVPGGGSEPGESETACIEREMLEETCLHVRVEYLLLDEPSLPDDIYQRSKTYVCSIVDGEPQPGCEPEEESIAGYGIIDVGWFDLRDAAAWGKEVLRARATFPLLQRIQAALGYSVADRPREDTGKKRNT